jgi:hypothetical protein
MIAGKGSNEAKLHIQATTALTTEEMSRRALMGKGRTRLLTAKGNHIIIRQEATTNLKCMQLQMSEIQQMHWGAGCKVYP